MRMTNITVNAKCDTDGITKKIESIIDDTTMTQIHQLFAETIDPWTPFRTGVLHEKVEIRPSGVLYTVPYASKAYYQTAVTKTEHPLATCQWDEVAMQSEYDAFCSKVRDILVARIQQLYG